MSKTVFNNLIRKIQDDDYYNSTRKLTTLETNVMTGKFNLTRDEADSVLYEIDFYYNIFYKMEELEHVDYPDLRLAKKYFERLFKKWEAENPDMDEFFNPYKMDYYRTQKWN